MLENPKVTNLKYSINYMLLKGIEPKHIRKSLKKVASKNSVPSVKVYKSVFLN